MTEKRVLLVWERIPDNTVFFAIPATKRNIAVLESANGKTIGFDDNTDGAKAVSLFLSDTEKYPTEEYKYKQAEELGVKKDEIGSWFKHMYEDPSEIGPVEMVFVSGWYS